MTKSLQHPYIKFIGSNSHEVTGSANLLRFMDYSILIDYGMRQTSNAEEDYKVNSKRHKDIKPKTLNAIILTHIHADHGSLIPSLFKDGADCPIYVPSGCKSILTLMWQDCNKIFNSEYEKFNRKPIYSQGDIDNALSHIIECDIHKKVVINDNISFTYYNAQHIIRSRQIYIELFDGINLKKVGFTGDVSNKNETYYLDDFEPLPQVDVLVGEATYANNKRLNKVKDRPKDIEKIEMAVSQAYQSKGKVLIPTFSLDRLQIMLTTLCTIYKDNPKIRILVDTPLGKSICSVWNKMIDKNNDLWQEVMNWDSVLWTSDFKDSIHWSQVDEPMIVLTGGGFLQGGRGVFWTQQLLGFKRNQIIFCGYSTPESVAGQIKNGTLKDVRIDGKRVSNKAHITILNSFSSHMDYEQLMEYYVNTQYNKICLVHSNQDDKIKFSNELKDRLSKANKTSRVVCTNYETKINI